VTQAQPVVALARAPALGQQALKFASRQVLHHSQLQGSASAHRLQRLERTRRGKVVHARQAHAREIALCLFERAYQRLAGKLRLDTGYQFDGFLEQQAIWSALGSAPDTPASRAGVVEVRFRAASSARADHAVRPDLAVSMVGLAGAASSSSARAVDAPHAL
jgi:hypothetical protein